MATAIATDSFSKFSAITQGSEEYDPKTLAGGEIVTPAFGTSWQTKLDAADKLSQMGFYVFPVWGVTIGKCDCGKVRCQHPGKHPHKLAPHGFKDATRKLDIVEALWSDDPNANIGVATGNGLVVVDVDGPEGEESLKRLKQHMGQLPETLQVRTGKGRHLYFHCDAETASSVAKWPGIDIRGHGGYVIGPGSTHQNGATYQFVDENVPRAELPPAWLQALQGDKVKPEKTATNISGVISEGNRNDELSRRAYGLKKLGLKADDLYQAVCSLNENLCDIPLPDKEIRAICHGKRNIESDPLPQQKTPEIQPKKLTAFQKVVDCVEEIGWEFFVDQYDNVYAYVHINGHHENVDLDSSQFKSLLRLEVKKTYDCGVSRDVIDQFIGTVKGELIHNPVRRQIFQRVGRIGGKILIDSGRADWKVYEITRDGWSLTTPEFNPFMRSEKFRAYQCDENTPRANWDDVFELLGISDTETQEIVKIWEATALINDIQRPGLVVYGPPGGGKTILSSFLRQVVDPSQEPVERFPRNDVRSLELKLHKNFIPAFDNLNTIDQETSDILCQVATGALFDSRKLFSDSETVSRYMMKPWILNGVGVPGSAADFLSRVFLVEVDCIPQKKRKAKEIIERELNRLIPGIQAWVFDCISLGLRKIDYVRSEGFERMADCHRYSLAMANMLGMSEETIERRWKENAKAQNSTAASGDILADLIPEFIGQQPDHAWTGSASKLLQDLHHHFNPDRQSYSRTFPKTANTLSRRINHLKSLLGAQGITIQCERGEHSRTLEIFMDAKDILECCKNLR